MVRNNEIVKCVNMKRKLLGVCVAFSFCALSACGKSESASTQLESEQVLSETTTQQETAEDTSVSETVPEDSGQDSEDVAADLKDLETVYLVTRERSYGAEGTMYGEHRYDYDDKGNMIKEGWFKESGDLEYFCEYEYDANGNNSKQILYSWNSSPSNEILKYDENGNKTESISYTTDDVIESYAEYDAHGKPVKILYYDADGVVCSAYECECEYDTNGNLIKEMNHDGAGTVFSTKQYEYDTNGNVTKEMSYDESGAVSSTTQYEYDANGNVTKETNYDIDGSIKSGYEDRYDDNGNVIKHIEFGPGGVTSYENQDQIWNMTYDANDNEIRSEITDANGYVTKAIETEYDANGNRIKCTRYELGSVNGWEEYEYVAMELPKEQAAKIRNDKNNMNASMR